MPDRPLAILKFGGSILHDRSCLPLVVDECHRIIDGGRRVIAVISAYRGLTDQLAARWAEESATARPDRAVALSAGEFQAATDTQEALHAAGIPARVGDLAAIGFRATGDPLDADPVGLDVGALEAMLQHQKVVVIPGFVALDPSDRLVLLGRGGSDLTAIHLACRMRPDQCDLLKDVDGIYATDPANAGPDARDGLSRFERLDFSHAGRLGDQVIQAKALALAEAHGLEFRVRSVGDGAGTVIGSRPTVVENDLSEDGIS